MKFRRYENLVRSIAPLAEGVTPTGQKLSYTDVIATLEQFGDLVSTTDVVEEVLAQLDAGLHAGQILLDTTTGEPEQTAALGTRLAARSIHYLDAPISGSSEQTRRGEATVIVGGDRATFEVCADLWRVMGQFALGATMARAKPAFPPISQT